MFADRKLAAKHMFMRYFLVGGVVRDLLLGLVPRDQDWTFEGADQEFLALNPTARKLGNKISTYILSGAEYSALKGSTPQEDILGRDFTVNAFLLEPGGRLHMHPESLKDLQSGVIRPVRPGALSDDPLRVFRAARFYATLEGFRLAPETLDQMREAAKTPAFAALAPERVGGELRKALAGLKPGNFLRALNQAGCLAPWFAELDGADAIPAGPPAFHQHSVLEHTAQVMDLCRAQAWPPEGFETDDPAEPKEDPRSLAAWMAMIHDLGKVTTEAGILPHHYGHETRSQAALPGLFRRLRLPGHFLKAGLLSAKHHMKAGRYEIHRPGVRVDMLLELHRAGLITPFFILAQADSRRRDLLKLASEELQVILNVHLPKDKQGLGEKSGRYLRDLQCIAMADWLGEKKTGKGV